MNRRKASFRLAEKTLAKLKRMSDSRKRSDRNSSQGKIIDDLVSSAAISNNRTIQLTSLADKRLKQIQKETGMPREKIVDYLITNGKIKLSVGMEMVD
jgi:SOS response regulatory protein OraA/RecX